MRERTETNAPISPVGRNSNSHMSRLCAVAVVIKRSKIFVAFMSFMVCVYPLIQLLFMSYLLRIEIQENIPSSKKKEQKFFSALIRFINEDEFTYNYSMIATSLIEFFLFLLCAPAYLSPKATEYHIFKQEHRFYYIFLLYSRLNFSWAISHFIRGIFLYSRSIISIGKLSLSFASLVIVIWSLFVDNVMSMCNVLISGTPFEEKIYTFIPDIIHGLIFTYHELLCCVKDKYVKTGLLLAICVSVIGLLLAKKYMYWYKKKLLNSFRLLVLVSLLVLSIYSIIVLWTGTYSTISAVSLSCFYFMFFFSANFIFTILENRAVNNTVLELESGECLRYITNPRVFINYATMYRLTNDEKLLLLTKGLGYFPDNFEIAIAFSKYCKNESSALDILMRRSRNTAFHMWFINIFRTLSKKNHYERSDYLMNLETVKRLTEECSMRYYMLFSEVLQSRPERIISLNIDCYKKSNELTQVMKNLYYCYQDNEEFMKLVNINEKLSFMNVKDVESDDIIGEDKLFDGGGHAIAKRFYNMYHLPIVLLRIFIYLIPIVMFIVSVGLLIHVAFVYKVFPGNGVDMGVLMTKMCENISLVNFATIIGPNVDIFAQTPMMNYLNDSNLFSSAFNSTRCDVINIYNGAANYLSENNESLKNTKWSFELERNSRFLPYYDFSGSTDNLDIASFYMRIISDAIKLLNQSTITTEEQFLMINNTMNFYDFFFNFEHNFIQDVVVTGINDFMEKLRSFGNVNFVVSLLAYLLGIGLSYCLHVIYQKIIWYDFIVPKKKIAERIDDLTGFLDLHLSVQGTKVDASTTENMRNILLQNPVKLYPTHKTRFCVIVCYYCSMLIITNALFMMVLNAIFCGEVKINAAVSNVYDMLTLTSDAIMFAPMSFHYMFNKGSAVKTLIETILNETLRITRSVFILEKDDLLSSYDVYADTKAARLFDNSLYIALSSLSVQISKLLNREIDYTEEKRILMQIVELSAMVINISIPSHIDDNIASAQKIKNSGTFQKFNALIGFIFISAIVFCLFNVVLNKYFTFADFVKYILLFLEDIIENQDDFVDNPQLDVEYDCNDAVIFDNHCADGILDPTFFLDKNDVICYMSPSAHEMFISQNVVIGITNANEYFPSIGFKYSHDCPRVLYNENKQSKMIIKDTSFVYSRSLISRVCIIIDDSHLISLEKRARKEVLARKLVESSLRPVNFEDDAQMKFRHAVVAFFRLSVDLKKDDIILLRKRVISEANKYAGMQIFCRSMSFFRAVVPIQSDESAAMNVDSMVRFAMDLSHYFGELSINSSICIALTDNAVAQVVMKNFSVDGVDPAKKYPSFEFLCSGISSNFEGLINTNAPNCVALTKSALEAVYDLGYDVSPFNLSKSKSGSKTLYRIDSF